jgi:group I intron endonuclease
MQETTFIYGLFDPRDFSLRYIGKADDLHKRWIKHMNESKRRNRSPREKWIMELLELGLQPIIKIIEEVMMEEWEKKEDFWIKYFKSLGNDLLNVARGGLGYSNGHVAYNKGTEMSEEQKEKIKNSTLGREVSEETRKKQSKVRRGVKNNKKNASSKYVGVTWDKEDKKWIAQFFIKRKHIYGGRFKNEKDAARKYNEMALLYWGEDAKLNIIEDEDC